MQPLTTRPVAGDAAPYYFTYIDQVPDGDILRTIEAQRGDAMALLESIGEQRSLHRYQPGKWSIREVLAHINDCERLFTFRAFWFARGFDTPLPSFDQDIASDAGRADERGWQSHVEEFRAIRAATQPFFGGLSSQAWDRRGIASGNPFTVRSLAWITAGHVAHHMRVLRERYL